MRRKNGGNILAATSYVSLGSLAGMIVLPQTGTALLLQKLTDFLDDSLINELVPPQRGPGQPRAFNSAQLFRVLLLSLLTPAHSFNLLLKLLPENRAWRKFAHLPNLRSLPDAKMLHQFRSRLDLYALREVNASLVRPLIASLDPSRLPLAIMDATDLPAAANAFKKTGRRWGQDAQNRAKPLVHRLQETQLAVMDSPAPGGCAAGAADVMDGTGQSRRRAVSGAQLAIYPQTTGFHPGAGCRGHGLHKSGHATQVAGRASRRDRHAPAAQL